MDSAKAWGEYYKSLTTPNNYYPESFVSRIFLSEKPVKFLDKNYKEKKILDLGCGHGRHIPFLVNQGFNVTGLEVTQEQIAILEEIFPNQNFITGHSANIPSQNNSFDYILACNSIYYLKDPSDCFSKHLSESCRILKQGGILIFSMIGAQHSILNQCSKENENAILKNDFLGFRKNTAMRPLWNKSEIDILLEDAFKLENRGEIIETCNGHTRHLHYIVAQKK